MEVLCIVSYDSNDGTVSGVVVMPPGAKPDEVFVRWLKANKSYWKDKTHKKCVEESLYAWHVNKVQNV